MTATGIEHMTDLHTVVAFRHGQFPLNVRASLTGEAALWAVANGIDPDADSTLDLLPLGRSQAELLQPVLGEFTIDACLCSPALRTQTTAGIGLAGHRLAGGIRIEPNLRERSRGIFSYEPDYWTKHHPLYRQNKASTMDWQPFGTDYNGNSGETIRYVATERMPKALYAANQTARELSGNGIIAFSTHAEAMLSLRAYLLKLDDAAFRRPIVPEPPAAIRALHHLAWVGNGQTDMYRVALADRPGLPAGWEATQFRTVITDFGLEYDTGWIDVTAQPYSPNGKDR